MQLSGNRAYTTRYTIDNIAVSSCDTSILLNLRGQGDRIRKQSAVRFLKAAGRTLFEAIARRRWAIEIDMDASGICRTTIDMAGVNVRIRRNSQRA
jgi:hypothetical protein